MIDIDIINGEIAELEKKELSYQVLNKLSVLYTVRNANILQSGNEVRSNNVIAQTIPDIDSDFIYACKGCNPERLWQVLDELMTAVQALYPKLYDETLKLITDIV